MWMISQCAVSSITETSITPQKGTNLVCARCLVEGLILHAFDVTRNSFTLHEARCTSNAYNTRHIPNSFPTLYNHTQHTINPLELNNTTSNTTCRRLTARRYPSKRHMTIQTPTDPSSQVTTDPETLNNPKNENPGVVTSDSLAGESIQEGGSFAANSDSRGPIGQPSYSTTTNNTDISNATRLDPAPDAEARLASEQWSEAGQLNAASKLGKESGVGPTYNASVGDSTNQSAVDPSMPKGKNLQEGGFDDSAPNASFNNAVGTKKDPGRAALNKFVSCAVVSSALDLFANDLIAGRGQRPSCWGRWSSPGPARQRDRIRFSRPRCKRLRCKVSLQRTRTFEGFFSLGLQFRSGIRV